MGVIQDGYYYPKPEEIFIGYQCEVCWSRGYDESYIPYIVRLKDENGAYLDNVNDLAIAIDDGYAEARVKLLSKEDVESLGWTDKHGHWWKIGEWNLSRVSSESAESSSYVEIKFGNSLRYFGPCPTLNELKYLMNLLKIEDGK